MNPDSSNPMRQQQTHQEAAESLQTQQTQAGQEFASVEKLIRHDAQNTPVPPALTERLHKSVALEPSPARSWWRKFLSGGE